MDRLRNQLSVSDAVASQFVRHYRSGITAVLLKQTLEKALGGLAASTRLQKYIDHLSIVIHGLPKAMLLSLNLNEHFVNEKRVANTWGSTP